VCVVHVCVCVVTHTRTHTLVCILVQLVTALGLPTSLMEFLSFSSTSARTARHLLFSSSPFLPILYSLLCDAFRHLGYLNALKPTLNTWLIAFLLILLNLSVLSSLPFFSQYISFSSYLRVFVDVAVVYMYIKLCMRVCVCDCVCERELERARVRERERESVCCISTI
jgi:hypothetical protein